MQLRNRIFAAILIPAAVLSIALPAVTLFTGDGFLAPYIRTPEAAKMLAEIAVLLLLSGGIFFLIKNKGRQAAAAALLGAAFCWLHVVFLPMVLSALYLGFLVLAGRFLREKVFGIAGPQRLSGRFPAGQQCGHSPFLPPFGGRSRPDPGHAIYLCGGRSRPLCMLWCEALQGEGKKRVTVHREYSAR